MANLLMTRRNWLDAAGVVLSGGSWTASLPLSNILRPEPSIVARAASTAPAATTVDIDLGTWRTIGLVATLGQTPAFTGRQRIRFGDDPAFASWSWDSTWVSAWPRDTAYGSLPWGGYEWGERVPPEVWAQLGRPRWFPLFADIFARYARFEWISDLAVGETFDLGRIVIGEVLRFRRNMSYDWAVEPIDESVQTRSLGGQVYTDERRRRRRLTFGYDRSFLDRDEALVGAVGQDLANGIGGAIAVVPLPDDWTEAIGLDIGDAGSGYEVNDVLTVAGGQAEIPAQIRVTEAAGGAIVNAVVERAGRYTAVPSNPAAVTGGAGADGTFTLTWSEPRDLHHTAIYGALGPPRPIIQPHFSLFGKSYSVEELV